MGWFSRFIVIFTCSSCKTTDERALKERNILRMKVGKNKIVPLASTYLEVKVEREEISPRDERGDKLTPQDKWAAPRTPSKESVSSDSVLNECVEFARNYVKTEILPGAIARFLAEKDRGVGHASASRSGGSPDMSINESVSELVQTSLTNAERLLGEEQESKMSVTRKHPQIQ